MRKRCSPREGWGTVTGPASIGPVKALLRRIDLRALRALIDEQRDRGATNLRPAVTRFLADS